MNSTSFEPDRECSSIVLHIPHSSTYVPPSVRRTFLLSDSELQHELLRITDAHTDELFRCETAAAVRYAFSRLVADPERFEDDSLEPMSGIGMGVIYERTSETLRLRETPSASAREGLLDAYYRPHHEQLTNAVADSLARHDRCLVIDCHSFPSLPLPYEKDQRLDRPDFCIGMDSHHTPPELLGTVIAAFREAEVSVDVNRPFAGSMVPARYYRREKKVCSLMIEVNRAMYMDETTGEKSSGFDKACEVISRVLRTTVTGFENDLGLA